MYDVKTRLSIYIKCQVQYFSADETFCTHGGHFAMREQEAAFKQRKAIDSGTRLLRTVAYASVVESLRPWHGFTVGRLSQCIQFILKQANHQMSRRMFFQWQQ
jgi:hypothetical protein